MTSTPLPGKRRKTLIASTAGALLLTGGAAWLQTGAGADSVSSQIPASCAIGTGAVDVTVPVRVDDKFDPVVEGGHQTLETETGLPSLPVEVTIDRMVVTMPIPEQIASIDAVTFAGGNMTGTYEVSGSDLLVTFTGPVQSSAIDVPVVTAEQTLQDGIAPTTIEWKTFSRIVADTSYGQATCTPDDPGQVVNHTEVLAGDREPGPTDPEQPAPTDPAPPCLLYTSRCV